VPRHLPSELHRRAGVDQRSTRAGYKTVNELLKQPKSEHVDYVPLKWTNKVTEIDGGKGALPVDIGYHIFYYDGY
jgi:hypothetical protein